MSRLFGTDGIRGIANKELTPDLCMRVGMALGKLLNKEKNKKNAVLIGTDTRESCAMISSAISAGLLASGSDVINVGVIPTPAVAFLTVKYGADAGIVISASHNPYEFNGIKIFDCEGFKLKDEVEDEIESYVRNGIDESSLGTKELGILSECKDAYADYVSHLLTIEGFDFNSIKIVIDTANGATVTTAQGIFEKTGGNCIYLSNTPNGKNINENCGSTHLEQLRRAVIKERADIGIAYDGDGDRCLAIDENGEVVDGDFIMAILSYMLKKENRLKKSSLVGTVMTNLGLKKFCDKNGISFISTKVGDRYVLEAMELYGYGLGGEQSGHIILRDYATTGDGQLTSLLLIHFLKKSKKKLSELKSIMEKYPQYEINVKADREQKIAFLNSQKIKTAIHEAEKELGESGRIIVRPSGTEPLIRIMTESPDPLLAKRIAHKLSETIAYLL